MSDHNFAKGVFPVIGSILILIGTSIGAGILALPLASAPASFPFAALILIIAWLVMTITGLLILEVSFAFPIHRNHFHTMSKATLGKIGPPLVWVSSLGLFYSLISAYISGNASLLIRTIQNTSHIQLPGWSSSCLFTFVMAGIVFFGTRGVDLLNRGLLTFKGIMLILVIISTMPRINLYNLSAHDALQAPDTLIKTLIFASPIFLTCFGYHAVIPSMINYLGPDKNKLRFIIITGTTISLILYLLWLIASFGIIPLTGEHSFTNIKVHGNSLDQFLSTIEQTIHSKWVHWALNAFSDVALTTSCLGVSLGLFDFLADGLKIKNDKPGRFKTLIITFLPPLLISIFYPNFFLLGLSIGAIFLVILEILIPVAMAYKFRKKENLSSQYKVSGGNSLLIIISIIGIIFLACDIISKFFA
jgi:tyrosine-specific transport protein